jgi:hypothetical protein
MWSKNTVTGYGARDRAFTVGAARHTRPERCAGTRARSRREARPGCGAGSRRLRHSRRWITVTTTHVITVSITVAPAFVALGLVPRRFGSGNRNRHAGSGLLARGGGRDDAADVLELSVHVLGAAQGQRGHGQRRIRGAKRGHAAAAHRVQVGVIPALLTTEFVGESPMRHQPGLGKSAATIDAEIGTRVTQFSALDEVSIGAETVSATGQVEHIRRRRRERGAVRGRHPCRSPATHARRTQSTQRKSPRTRPRLKNSPLVPLTHRSNAAQLVQAR